ncbi:MAG: hypothetical protein QOD84_1199 [Acidobacteriaceae bacterium]
MSPRTTCKSLCAWFLLTLSSWPKATAIGTSQDRKDILNSYSLGANSYVTKPGNLPDFISAVTSIGNFWFTHAQLPVQEKR